MLTAERAVRSLRKLSSPKRAKANAWFFKTGPGEYGEGDRFIGVTVPQVRQVARTFRDLPLSEVQRLVKHAVHEIRLLAVLILVGQFQRAKDRDQRKRLHQFYLRHTRWVNNWDLVDSSAGYLVGEYLDGRGQPLLRRLATSRNMWERRIAMIATFHDIRKGRFVAVLDIAGRLVRDSHDLIHKATGWMLREKGNRGGLAHTERFLRRHGARMPRTMLRYAIERFPRRKRLVYLRMKDAS